VLYEGLPSHPHPSTIPTHPHPFIPTHLLFRYGHNNNWSVRSGCRPFSQARTAALYVITLGGIPQFCISSSSWSARSGRNEVARLWRHQSAKYPWGRRAGEPTESNSISAHGCVPESQRTRPPCHEYGWGWGGRTGVGRGWVGMGGDGVWG
jgi:hypothetical protein